MAVGFLLMMIKPTVFFSTQSCPKMFAYVVELWLFYYQIVYTTTVMPNSVVLTQKQVYAVETVRSLGYL